MAHDCTLLTKTTAAQNEGALSYHSVRGLYFQAVVFVATIAAKLIRTLFVFGELCLLGCCKISFLAMSSQ